jgi:ketosteroid isomerase-like protein
MNRHPLLTLPLLALLVACSASQPPPTSRAGAPRADVPVERAQKEAMAADEGFSAAAVAHDARAFAAFLARDAVFIGRGGVSAGVPAVLTDWAKLLAPEGPTLSWKPDRARGSSGGDLVVTQGAWALQPAGGGEVRTGRYVTVWERGADGKLKVALDGPDQPLPPESASAVRHPLKRLLSEDERLGAVAGMLMDGTREVGGFLLVEVREGKDWRVLIEVGAWRPDRP